MDRRTRKLGTGTSGEDLTRLDWPANLNGDDEAAQHQTECAVVGLDGL